MEERSINSPDVYIYIKLYLYKVIFLLQCLVVLVMKTLTVTSPKQSQSQKLIPRLTKDKLRKKSAIYDHQPTLPTIKMVEEMIRKSQYFSSKNQIFRKLPKQVMYQTLIKILDYLVESNKIEINKDGSIVWIFADSPQIKKLLKESKPFKKL